MAEDGFIYICSRFKLLGPAACSAVLSPPRSQASSRLVLRTRAADDYDDDSADGVKLAWRAWMKEEVTVSEGLSCEVLDWWKANSIPRLRRYVSVFSSGPST